MGAFEILWALAILASGTLFAGWFGMRVERRYRPAAIFFVLGFIPLVAIDLAWTAVTSESWGVRLIVSGLIGAVAGAAILIASMESLRWLVTGAETQGKSATAQSETPSKHPDTLAQQNVTPSSPAGQPPIVNQGPGSAYSFGQQGGVTAGTVNIGPTKRSLSDPRAETLKHQMLSDFPRDKPITITALLGDAESVEFANEIHDFLKQNGFKMKEPDGITQGVFTKPPKGLIRDDRSDGEINLIVGTP
jgi:hypothetical protein